MRPPRRNLTAEEFDAFQRRIVQKCKPEIAKATIAFLGWWQEKLVQNGTGILFRVMDSYFIITAAHVLDFHTIHGISYYTAGYHRPSKPILLPIVRHYSSPIPAFRSATDQDMRDDDPLDIGVAEIPNEVARQLTETNRSVQLLEVDTSPDHPQGCYYLFGYPCDYTVTDEESRTIQSAYLSYTTGLYTGGREPRDEMAELLLTYPMEGRDFQQNPVSAPKPFGLSGCGIWLLADPGRVVEHWRPEDLRLVGVQHRWRSKNGYVRGTGIRHAIKLIYDNYPHLRPAMDIVYARIDLE